MTLQDMKEIALDVVAAVTAGMNADHNQSLLEDFTVTDFRSLENEGFDPSNPMNDKE